MAILLPGDDCKGFNPVIIPRPTRAISAFGTGRRRFYRLGRHWRFTVMLRKIPDHRVEDWLDLERDDDEHLWPIPQGFSTAGAGTPRVNGGGQLGMTLNTDGWTAGYTIAKGRWLPVITGARRYLYRTRAAVTASGAGVAALPLSLPLRVAPANDDLIEADAPKIEGLVDFEGFKITQGFAAPTSFIITEQG